MECYLILKMILMAIPTHKTQKTPSITAFSKDNTNLNKASSKQLHHNSTFQFVDNRPETAMQRKLSALANNQIGTTIQKQELEEEELLQGKFKTTQRQELEEEELLQGKFNAIQKQELEEEELIQGKFKTIQRQELEEEELLQGKFNPVQKRENNTGLPDQLKTGMENLSGMNLNHVKTYYNSAKPAQLNAHAYAQGSNIHLASGQEKHLPHELAHVVQQTQGRVKPTTSVNGMAVNDNIGLEKEADVMGAKALKI
jgi:hypothetical protein